LNKLKEKLSSLTNSETTTKILEMNYDQLALYTLKVENYNKQLEEKNNLNERKIKDLEFKLEELNKFFLTSLLRFLYS